MSNSETESSRLVDISADSSNERILVLMVCPICNRRLFDNMETCRQTHPEEVASHIANHTPSDLGIEGCYSYKPMADILIELHGLNERAES